MVFHAYDTNNNGKLDYVEWTVPHLSEQIFEIIFISKAFELDQDQNIVADIYDTVSILDQNYATVPANNYVRTTFNSILDNSKDITLYAKPTNSNTPISVKVFPVYIDEDGNQTEGQMLETVSDGTNPDFSNIDHDGKYRILLQNLQTPTDVFDLKVVGGSVDFDFIVDPPITLYWVGAAGAAQSRAAQLQGALDAEKQLSQRAQSAVELLNQQISAMRRQLAALEEALGASEARDKESQTRISDLGSRLNVALAQRVQELARYRSDFFGRMRQILGNRPDIRVVGDRFVFQSEVFFDAGAALLKPEGQAELDKLAAVLTDIAREIPPDIPWIVRVDGHTDVRPIRTAQFPSNWHLATARAVSVVEYLATKGLSPERLAATGFGEFQPLELGTTDEAFRRNRRIEFKITER
jgi:flagellar motor protein MotB